MSSKEETKKASSDFGDRGLHIFDILHLLADTVDGYSPGYAIITAGSISSSKDTFSQDNPIKDLNLLISGHRLKTLPSGEGKSTIFPSLISSLSFSLLAPR